MDFVVLRLGTWCCVGSVFERNNSPSNIVQLTLELEQKHRYCSAAATFGVQVGLRDFTCCMCNHNFSRRGMVPCDKIVATKILAKMLTRTINFHFANGDFPMARWLLSGSHIFLAGLPWKSEWEHLDSDNVCVEDEVKRFKKALRWRTEDEENSKFNGMDVLKYAIIARNYVVVKYYVDKILRETEPNSRERVARLSSPTTHPMIHTVRTWLVFGVRALVLSQNNSIVSLSLVISIN